MKSPFRLFKARKKDHDESKHDLLKREVIQEVSKDINNKNFKTIESHIEDKPQQDILFGFSIRTVPEESIQMKTTNGLYIKISTIPIKGDN